MLVDYCHAERLHTFRLTACSTLLNAFIFDQAARSPVTCEPSVHASSPETCYWLILFILNVMMKGNCIPTNSSKGPG